MFTQSFASELADRLLETILDETEDVRLRDLLLAQSYFAFYALQRAGGDVPGLVEADAPSWLQLALELLEQ